jgi:hypothetical protein
MLSHVHFDFRSSILTIYTTLVLAIGNEALDGATRSSIVATPQCAGTTIHGVMTLIQIAWHM